VAARTLAALRVRQGWSIIAVTVGAPGVTRVIKIDVVPIIGRMAVGALAGPMVGRRCVASCAIGIAGMVKNYVGPTGAGNVAG